MRMSFPLAAESGLHAIDYGVVAIYLGAVLYAGWYFSREQKAGDDYFVAGRQMPWMAVGLSIIATLLSTVSYLAAPGEVIQHGLALSLGWLALPLSFIVINFVWIPFLMRLKVTSIYEYLELRFGTASRWLAVVLFTFILRLLWMATIVLTASRAVAQITYDSATSLLPGEISPDAWTLILLLAVGMLATVYTMLGGIKAVIWTDVAQFVALFVGIVLTLIFVAWRTGTGPVEWWDTTINGAGHEFPPLISFDITERSVVLFTVLNSVFWYSCTFLADQVAVQRYFTVPTLKAAVKGNIVNFIGDWIVMIMLALCGMALLTYYLDPEYSSVIVEKTEQVTEKDGSVTEKVIQVSDPRDARAADQVFPHFIAHGLPVGISGLVVAALFAVAMSSLDSGMNSVSAVLTVDVFNRLKPDRPKTDELRLARIITLVVGIVCTLVALAMMNIPENYNIIGITGRTFNCALGPLAALFVCGMFFRHVSNRAAVIGCLTGFAVALASAWWVELRYAIGLTEAETLKAALTLHKGPSVFLITPLATVSGILVAGLAGIIFRENDLQRAERYSWRGVIQSDR